jgi:hypothetical protein
VIKGIDMTNPLMLSELIQVAQKALDERGDMPKWYQRIEESKRQV